MLSTKHTVIIPQVSQSHTVSTDPGCLMDSGGGSPTLSENPKIPKSTKKTQSNNKLIIASWNIKTLLDPQHKNSISIPRRTAVIARELRRYKVDIAALQETHLKNSGQLEERNAGYTYLWSGCEENEQNHYGVAICVRTELIKKGIVSEPCCYSDRMMSVQIFNQNTETTFIACYAPTLNADPHIIETFYQELKATIEKVPKKNKIILTGDFNARVGKKQNEMESAIGLHGTGIRNENGLRLLNLCTQQNLRIVNTCFQQKDKYKTMWQHPRTKQWHQIDHIITRASDATNVLRCRSMRGAQCETDHNLIRATIRLELRKYHHAAKKPPKAFDIKKLKTETIQAQYQSAIETNFTAQEDQDIESIWKSFKEATTKAASDILGARKHQRPDWFDESDALIDSVLKKKREEHNKYLATPSTNQKKKYVSARKRCQTEVRKIKEKWWIQKTDELQTMMNTNDTYNLYRSIKEIVGPIKKALNIIEDSKGEVLKSKNEQLARWREHFDNLLNQEAQINLDQLEIVLHTTSNPADVTPIDEPPSEMEITKALGQLKNNKSPGQDLITAELLKGGQTSTLKIIHTLFNKVWTEKCLPKDWKSATVVPIHKKGSKRKCDNYRGISLLSVPGKLLARIIYNRLLPFIESYIDDTQCGFRSNHSTTDMIFAARQLIEKTLEQNTQACIAFVDISKAFDSVNRDALFKILEHINCPTNLLIILKLLHQDTTSTVLVEGETSEPFDNRTGVKQGCVLAPVLFLLYIQAIMNKTKTESQSGIDLVFRSDTNMLNKRGLKSASKVKSTKLSELMFADDAALVAKTPDELQNLVNAFNQAAKTFGLNVNVQKTEVMFVNCQSTPIQLNGNTLKEVDSFKYLGSKLTKNGDISCEIKNRVNAANQAFARLYNRVWKPHNLSLKTKIQIYNTIVLSTLLYSSECWTLKAKHIQELNSFHLRCLRTIAHINWKDMIPNEVVLQKTNMLKLDELIRIRRLRWAGHLSRMSEDRIPHQIAFSELSEGKRAQQKPKKRWTDMMRNDLKLLKINEKDWRSTASDRNLWRSKIHESIQHEHEKNIQQTIQKRQDQHEEQDQWEWQCPLCEFRREGRKGRQYVNSHISQAHKDRIPTTQRNDSLVCEYCGLVVKSKAGLTSHVSHRHPEAQPNTLKPVKIVLMDNTTTSTQPTQQTQPTTSNGLTCPACGRTCRSKAGLTSHMKGASCRGTAQSQTTSHR
ncbi:hypothetical protein WDU94_005664 [Cyamophila willieti]